jgi:hypothetical protein
MWSGGSCRKRRDGRTPPTLGSEKRAILCRCIRLGSFLKVIREGLQDAAMITITIIKNHLIYRMR